MQEMHLPIQVITDQEHAHISWAFCLSDVFSGRGVHPLGSCPVTTSKAPVTTSVAPVTTSKALVPSSEIDCIEPMSNTLTADCVEPFHWTVVCLDALCPVLFAPGAAVFGRLVGSVFRAK